MERFTIVCNLCRKKATLDSWDDYDDEDDYAGTNYTVECSDGNCPNESEQIGDNP